MAFDDEGVLRATVAGVLFCCRSPEEWIPNAGITATRYRGTDPTTGEVDAQTIGGPLRRQVAEAVAFASRNMAVVAHKIPACAELPQYSPEAIFEAVVNAVAHRTTRCAAAGFACPCSPTGWRSSPPAGCRTT